MTRYPSADRDSSARLAGSGTEADAGASGDTTGTADCCWSRAGAREYTCKESACIMQIVYFCC